MMLRVVARATRNQSLAAYRVPVSAAASRACAPYIAYWRCLSTAPDQSPFMPTQGERPPSEKQMSFAESLATKYGAPIPPEAIHSSFLMSQYIDEVLDANPQPPTEKQLKYAQSLADEKGALFKDEMKVNRRTVSKFIDELISGSGQMSHHTDHDGMYNIDPHCSNGA